MPTKFNAEISKFEKGLWSYHIIVPKKIYDKFNASKIKRIVCSINNNDVFHAGFMPDGNGQWFIKLNKDKMKNFELELGQTVAVTIEEDKSKYGMKMPEEFEEVLYQDIEGALFFEQLTDGKKRSLIYSVASVKNTDKKITKALIILDHLKANSGKLDFKMLNEAFKGS